jgi:hypothetical protein
VGGSPMATSEAVMASTASPSETPGVVSKEMVTAGNCPWWLRARGALAVSNRGQGFQA